MYRCLVNILFALSTILCLATIVLWVRSYFVYDNIEYRTVHVTSSFARERSWSLRSNFAVFKIYYHSDFIDSSEPLYDLEKNDSHIEHEALIPVSLSFWRQIAGLILDYETRAHASYIVMTVPAWVLAACFAIAPFMGFRSLYSRHKHPEKCCSKCGYDLRATSHRCPECGRPPAADS
jgi:hypothetical protein